MSGTADRPLSVFFLDVGQGDATVVLPPPSEGGAVIFDCRDDHVVGTLLRHWSVERIAAVIASHLDLDHIAGMEQFLKQWESKVDRVFLSSTSDVTDDHPEAKKAKSLLDYVRSRGATPGWEILPSTRDPRPVLNGSDWAVHVLAPSHVTTLDRERTGSWEESNRLSAVLRVSMGDQVLLVGGDAPLATWAALTETDRKAGTFRMPHHGGALDDGGVPVGWNAARLYSEVGADVAVVSVGSLNSHGHPDPDWTRAARRDGKCRLMCTQVTGRCDGGFVERSDEHLKFVLARNHLVEPEWRHGRDHRRRSRDTPVAVPCAGTVVVTLYPDGRRRVAPSADGDHKRVVDQWGTPLCRP